MFLKCIASFYWHCYIIEFASCMKLDEIFFVLVSSSVKKKRENIRYLAEISQELNKITFVKVLNTMFGIY